MTKPKTSKNSNPKGIKLKCKNPKCRYTWRYKGTKDWGYATCPKCLNKVKI